MGLYIEVLMNTIIVRVLKIKIPILDADYQY